MTKVDSILKSRDITLPTKVHIVKAMVFLVVMCRCESWTIKKAVLVLCLTAQSCLTVWELMDCSSPGSSVHRHSPDKCTGVDCHAVLQGIFPTQVSHMAGTFFTIWDTKNWCFWTVVLEKTLESPLDSKEIKLVNPKGNQSWMFIGRNDAEAEVLILYPPDVKRQLIEKDPDSGKDWRQKEKGVAEDEMSR